MGRRNGLHIIRIAKGFGMEVVASDVIRNRLHAEVLGFRYVDTDELLACLDLPAHSQDAILPVAELVAAFSSPGQGVLHLIQMIVTPEEASEAEQETKPQSYDDVFSLCSRSSQGSVKKKVEPACSSDWNQMCPPWRSTSSRQR